MSTRRSEPEPLNVETEVVGVSKPENNEQVAKGLANELRHAGRVDEDTETTDTTAEYVLDNSQRSAVVNWRVWILFLFPLVWLVYALGNSIAMTWQSNRAVAIPLAVVTVMFFTVLGRWILAEYRAAREVDAIVMVKQITSEAQPDDSPREIADALEPVISRLIKYHPREVAIYRAEFGERTSVETYRELVENVLLSKADRRVDELIRNATLSAAGLVAISPHPVLDAMIVLYRATALVRAITEAYGRTATGLSSLRLFRHIIMSALTTATIEAVGTMGVESLGLGASEQALKGVGEGAFTALRMNRLGRITKEVVRPL
ncbi:hypothetical protein NOR53_2499 [gamma proteobacterium NOR5-3]|nr:hypothetical protein NOR53_2499 [gamma proteobacterium NOR5-3]